jgi:hypothetical protein
MNLFWAAMRNVTPVRRFESLRRFNPLPRPTKSAAWFCEREVVFGGSQVESFPLREIRLDVSLRTFATPTALRPARFKKRGGRANRRRCARWRRFPSDCRVQPHSNMRSVVLCRNFSGGAFVSRSLRTREIGTEPTAIAPKAKHVDRVERAERSGVAPERFSCSDAAD